MGGCIGINRSRRSGNDNSNENVSRPTSGSTRKNHPLCHETIRWRSDVPLTEGQLRSKRDEFWETAPAFEGRKEIWDALRAAAVAAEALDFQLAQAILDGANISVPNGYLTECYDELGTRYQVPVYCLSYPINIVKEDSGRDSPGDNSGEVKSMLYDENSEENVSSLLAHTTEERLEPVEGGTEITLKLRLSSTCQDVKLPIFTTDTIGTAKRKLQYQEGLEPSRQRWFFGGKLLGDKLHIEDAKISPGYVVQVIVNPADS